MELIEPVYASLAQMIGAWAERTPGAPAVCQGDRTWTYADLVGTANALVPQLPAGEVVVVTGPPSFELVAKMLAVLSSRSILLTIDPNLPERRRQLLLEQVGTGRLTGDAAYLFFTSGTTGVPKGVVGCHKSISHFLTWQRDTFGVGPGDRVAQLTSLSFDAVLRSVFLPLVSGATLCLPPDSVNLTAESVLPWLKREAITLLHVVPSLAQTWLTGAYVPSLRIVFFSGEPLFDSFVRRWRANFPTARVVNFYGPTETTMIKFFYEVPAEPDPGVQPAGWPMPQTEALLLADDEIAIRTPFRTLGYLNAPDEQRQRFIPNPHRDDPADLLYRTGDRGRYRADGALEILGRLDDQVKIQGVRIEPDEVNAVIARHPAVKASVVVVRKGPALTAYVVAPGLTEAALREYLRGQLPAEMVPAAVVFLVRLPLAPNGKVDRQALPAVVRSFVAPRSELERRLASLWREVLGVETVGLEDNFFELGGNSLRLTQVHGKLQNENVPITTLFQYPTIRTLAEYLSQQTPRKSSALNARQRAARQIAARHP